MKKIFIVLALMASIPMVAMKELCDSILNKIEPGTYGIYEVYRKEDPQGSSWVKINVASSVPKEQELSTLSPENKKILCKMFMLGQKIDAAGYGAYWVDDDIDYHNPSEMCEMTVLPSGVHMGGKHRPEKKLQDLALWERKKLVRGIEGKKIRMDEWEKGQLKREKEEKERHIEKEKQTISTLLKELYEVQIPFIIAQKRLDSAQMNNFWNRLNTWLLDEGKEKLSSLMVLHKNLISSSEDLFDKNVQKLSNECEKLLSIPEKEKINIKLLIAARDQKQSKAIQELEKIFKETVVLLDIIIISNSKTKEELERAGSTAVFKELCNLCGQVATHFASIISWDLKSALEKIQGAFNDLISNRGSHFDYYELKPTALLESIKNLEKIYKENTFRKTSKKSKNERLLLPKHRTYIVTGLAFAVIAGGIYYLWPRFVKSALFANAIKPATVL